MLGAQFIDAVLKHAIREMLFLDPADAVQRQREVAPTLLGDRARKRGW